MPFVNTGSLGVRPGSRDELVEILTSTNSELADAGCLLYEVGINDSEPDKCFVVEIWESADAHAASLQLESVKAAISEAMPILSGEMDGMRFTAIGSPLPD